jgi:hypothetical protein
MITADAEDVSAESAGPDRTLQKRGVWREDRTE